MRAVNLLPRDANRRDPSFLTAKNLPALVGGGVGAVTLCAVALLYTGASSKAETARIDLENAKAQLAAMPAPPPEQLPAYSALATDQAQRLTALSQALTGRVSWDRILRQFSLVLPDDVWLSTLSMHSPAVDEGGSGNKSFSISGYTYSHASVARLLSRLALIPELTNVSLTSSARQSEQDRTVLFTITADIEGAPTAASPPGATAIPTAPTGAEASS